MGPIGSSWRDTDSNATELMEPGGGGSSGAHAPFQPGGVEYEAVIPPLSMHRTVLARLLGGLLLPTSPRIDWATLLRRTFEID
ncbi:MAG: hypothetical protein IT372_36680 [Polyangiaceae bacterium]|nr:hypothetical protein [Polyangiaceae bacterium]